MGLAGFLLPTILAGLIRILRGPTAADRMQAAMLLGTTGVPILLLLVQAFTASALRDMALLFSLLAAVTVVTFVLLSWSDLE
ncbi:MAG TPA: pH regulation protein F [Gammaproteobacteria bacterium]|nr:pH regulation protein F [Gammaproteobacteria bacterium]